MSNQESLNTENLKTSSMIESSPPRRTSSSNSRFEIEKVSEKPSESSTKPNVSEVFWSSDVEEIKEKPLSSSRPQSADMSDSNKPSVLKKTVKHYSYDDKYFDLDSHQNTLQNKQEKNKYIPLVQQKNEEEEPFKLGKDASGDDDLSLNMQPGNCFQIDYDSKNEPIAITCNLNSSGVTSYKNCVHDFKTIALYQKLTAEFIGTCLLTLYACSIGLPIAEKSVPSLNGCLGGGLTLATLVWCFGNVSGGHFNPAVTIAFLFTGKINPLLTILYVGSQLFGALTGASILKSVSPIETSVNLSITGIHKDITIGQAIGVELIITFILVLTIFSCVDSSRNDLHGSFPLQIGLAVAVGGLFGGKFTGGSMNPARSFGPALASSIWKDHWVYWFGPITGAVLAGLIYQFLLTLKCPRKSISRSSSRA